jgi:hypothetical protein
LQATSNIKIDTCFENLNEFMRKESEIYLFSGHTYEVYSWGSAKYCHDLGVTIDEVWIGEWIY